MANWSFQTHQTITMMNQQKNSKNCYCRERCRLCHENGHCLHNCQNPQYLNNKNGKCGCSYNEVMQARENSTRKGMTTHCCTCKKPEAIYAMNEWYECIKCQQNKGQTLVRKWQPYGKREKACLPD